MIPQHDRRTSRGFSLVEVTISSAILAGALLTALSISQGATRASNRAVVAAARDASITRRLDRLRRIATRIAASTLRAVPSSNSGQAGEPEPVPEPMVDGASYDNLSYREPVGFVDGETVYSPPTSEDPRRIELIRDQRTGIGTLVLTDGDRQFDLAQDVTSVSFTRVGDELAVDLTTAGADDGTGGPATRRVCVALRVR